MPESTSRRNAFMQAVAKMMDKMGEVLKIGDIRKPGRQIIDRTTPAKKHRSQSRQNHSKGTSKVRRKMAQASNRINRKRVKHWKH